MDEQIFKKTAEKGPQKHHLFKYVSAKYLRLETRVRMKNTKNQPSKTLEHLAELKYNIYVCTLNVGTTRVISHSRFLNLLHAKYTLNAIGKF